MLGGGFLQNYVIKKAKSLGYRVLVLDGNPSAVGFKEADEYEVINIVDEEACLKYARKHNIDGVLTAATDFSVLSMSRVSEEMGLPGIKYSAAKRIKNKAAVRKCLFEANADDTGYSYEIDSVDAMSQIMPRIHFPIMMKPCDGSGSRGASRVDNADDFERACLYAMNGSMTHRAVAEPFVVGQEYGVESFVDNGVIHVLGIMRKDMTKPPYYAELGHSIPSGLPPDIEEKVISCVESSLIALDVNHGSVNMDLIIGTGNDIHIVDVGARMGGNLIGSHIIPIGTGIDYMENMIRAAVGDSTDFNPVREPIAIATKLLALTPGKIKKLPDFLWLANKFGVLIEHHLNVGDTIREYHTNLDGCGYVIATGDDAVDASIKAVRALKAIDEMIVREDE